MASKSDEVLVAALIEHGTIRDAAKAVNIGERTFYDRMKSPEFQIMYDAAKADIMRAAVLNISKHLQTAVDTIAEILQDKDINPATRLQAAQTILNHAGKLQERLADQDKRATKKPPSPLEQALEELCL